MEFNPGDSKDIDSDIIVAYSLMEITRTLDKISSDTPINIEQNFEFPKRALDVSIRKSPSWFERWNNNRKLRKRLKNMYSETTGGKANDRNGRT